MRGCRTLSIGYNSFFAGDPPSLASAWQAHERLAQALLQLSIAPHQFQKTNRIAQWTNLADLIGVNSCDRDRLNPVAFSAGDDENLRVIIESVSAAKQLWNQLAM